MNQRRRWIYEKIRVVLLCTHEYKCTKRKKNACYKYTRNVCARWVLIPHHRISFGPKTIQQPQPQQYQQQNTCSNLATMLARMLWWCEFSYTCKHFNEIRIYCWERFKCDVRVFWIRRNVVSVFVHVALCGLIRKQCEKRKTRNKTVFSYEHTLRSTNRVRCTYILLVNILSCRLSFFGEKKTCVFPLQHIPMALDLYKSTCLIQTENQHEHNKIRIHGHNHHQSTWLYSCSSLCFTLNCIHSALFKCPFQVAQHSNSKFLHTV